VALECLENSGRYFEKTTYVSPVNTFKELLGHGLRQRKVEADQKVNNPNISLESTEKPLAMF
jgi:hypothetical protein